MSRDYKTKVFKSGNSVAIRIPKALGLSEGDEFDLIPRADGGFELRPLNHAEMMTLDQLYGSFSKDFMASGRGDIEQVEREWNERRSSRDAT